MIKVDFWQGRYETGQTPWDLGGPSPHFETLLSRKPDWLCPGRIAVLGAGRGHDAALFARAGFEVTGFDYAPGAVAEAQRLYPAGNAADQNQNALNFVQADVFELASPDSPWRGQFDYILEHTCFCAIFPSDRESYARSAANLLKPGGLLMGVFWDHADTDGPPFSTTEADILETFGPAFEPVSMEPLPPAADRSGIERLVILKRKAG
jgi:SAM-dependent methyltransferase